MKIAIQRHPNPPAPPTKDFGFGQIFTPHIFKLDYRDGSWQNPRIEPYAPITLDPSCKVFHYGQETFEGMKAHENPRARAEENCPSTLPGGSLPHQSLIS